MDFVVTRNFIEDSPLINKQVNPFDKSYDSLRPAKEGADEGVMFLAAPAYGSSANAYSNSLKLFP
jgi:hypothetical protein